MNTSVNQAILRPYQPSLGQITARAVLLQTSRQLHAHLMYFLPGGGSLIGWGGSGHEQKDRNNGSTVLRWKCKVNTLVSNYMVWTFFGFEQLSSNDKFEIQVDI